MAGESASAGTIDPEIASAVEAVIWQRNAKREGPEIRFLCPSHKDTHPSARYHPEKQTWYCDVCHIGSGMMDLARRLDIPVPERRNSRGARKQRESKRIVAIYDYRDEAGTVLFQTVRYDPKDFRQRRPDGKGGHVWNLDSTRLVLYRLPELAAAGQGASVYIVEGEKDADNAAKAGILATTSPLGAGKWRDEYADLLRGRQAVILPDNDDAGRAHAEKIARSLFGLAAGVKILELPDLPPKGDLSDWIVAGGDATQLAALAQAAPRWTPGPTKTLDEVIATFRRWLYLDDTGPIEVLLGVVQANRNDGDPVWLLMVNPPGGGKTELVSSIVNLPEVHGVAVLTEASLLSGTPAKDRASDAEGGLLTSMGARGLMLIKDFSGMLSMSKDARGPILAALREVYDGSWTRYVGSEGGRKLHWEGKAGLIGAATPAIDGYHAVMSTLGERFVFYRMPEDQRIERAETALMHFGRERVMRAELAQAVKMLFAGLPKAPDRPELSAAERDWLINLSDFAVLCRSSVERDSFTPSKEIVLIPGAEFPTRMVKVLAQLFAGLLTVGVARERAWELVRKVALDCMPRIRRLIIGHLAAVEGEAKTADIATAIGIPTNTARRALEELSCYSLISRESRGGSAGDIWGMRDLARQSYAAVVCLPQTWGGDIEICGDHVKHENIPNHVSGKQPDSGLEEVCVECGAPVDRYDANGRALCELHAQHAALSAAAEEERS